MICFEHSTKSFPKQKCQKKVNKSRTSAFSLVSANVRLIELKLERDLETTKNLLILDDML